MKKLLLENWPKVIAVAVAALTIAWLYGCQPKVPSLLDDRRPVTRAELQLELETLQRKFEIRSADLAQKEELRRLITQNALLIAQTGTVNPLGVLTGLAALYGVGSATNTAKNQIKKRLPAHAKPDPTA